MPLVLSQPVNSCAHATHTKISKEAAHTHTKPHDTLKTEWCCAKGQRVTLFKVGTRREAPRAAAKNADQTRADIARRVCPWRRLREKEA